MNSYSNARSSQNKQVDQPSEGDLSQGLQENSNKNFFMSGVNKENFQDVHGSRALKTQGVTATKRSVLNNVTNTTLQHDYSNPYINEGSSSYTSTLGKVLRQAKSKLQTARVVGSLIPQARRDEMTLDHENKKNTSTSIQSTTIGFVSVRNAIPFTTRSLSLHRIVVEPREEHQSTVNDQIVDRTGVTSETTGSTALPSSKTSEKLVHTSNVDTFIVTKPNSTNNDTEDKILKHDPVIIERKNFIPNIAPDNANTIVSTITDVSFSSELNSGVNKNIHSQLVSNLELDIKKKRPISTVVEPEDPKKFKVCEGNHGHLWDNLDAEDVNDPFMVSEYVNDIFKYLHKLEVMTLPNRHDLFKHANIQQNRDILVNWMVKIHNKFSLLPETLYLALNIMDRFLGKELIQLEKLQLVGTACLFIASKYEEVYSPSVKHFAYETDGACGEDEIKEGEKFILKTLQFNLNYPNPMNFLRRISKADDYDIQSRTLAKYLLEISIVDFKFIGVLPSLCAAASMFLSRKMLGKGKWNENLIHYSGGYTISELAPVCNMLMEYLVHPVIHDELFKKYASRRFMKASVISRQWAKKVISRSYDIMTLHETIY